MFIDRIAVVVVALSALAPLPAAAQGAARTFWVCVGADGERKAHDRACSADQQTVSAPASASGASSSRQADPPLPASAAASRPNPYQPILDTAIGGLSAMFAVLLAIGALKLLWLRATRRRNPAPTGRSTTGRSTHRAPPSAATRQRYGVEHAPPSAPAPAATSGNPPAATAWSLALIRALEWKRFEELCVQFWCRKGYPARLTGAGADGGVDVAIADQRDPARIFAVAQCKAWSSKPVGVEAVRALWGAKDHFKATLALFYGLSGFTPDARAFAVGKPLKLISGEELLQQIQSLPATDQAAMLTEVTDGDYTTPTCPTCNTKMNRRPGRDGKPDFWGCNNYRRCGARPIPCRR